MEVSYFLECFTRDGVHWNSFVVDWVLLPKFQGLFVPGKARNSLFRSRPLFFGVTALRVYFRRPRPYSSLAGFCSTPPDGKCYLCLYTSVTRTFRFGPIRFLTPPPPVPPTLLSLPFSGVLSSLFFFFNSLLFRAPHVFFLYFRLLFRYVPLWFLARAPEFPTRGLNTEADRQSTMQSTVLSSKAVSTTVVYLRASRK